MPDPSYPLSQLERMLEGKPPLETSKKGVKPADVQPTPVQAVKPRRPGLLKDQQRTTAELHGPNPEPVPKQPAPQGSGNRSVAKQRLHRLHKMGRMPPKKP